MTALYRAFDTPDIVFLAAPLCGIAGLAILLHALSFSATRLRSPWVHAALLALLPELIYDGLFFNTTALAMPTAAAALWLLAVRPGRVSTFRSGVIGGLLAVSVLLRFDFLLMVPVVAALIAVRGRSIRGPIGYAAGGLAVLAAAIALGWIRPAELLDTIRVHHDEVNLNHAAYPWDWKANTKVIAVMFHPVAWVITLVGLPVLAKDFRRRHGAWAVRVVAIAALPLFYPFTSFVSPNYALPLMLLQPFVMLAALERLCERWSPGRIRLLSIAVVAIAALAWLVSIEPSKRLPFVRATAQTPKPIGTHDGLRTFGAYWVTAKWIGADDSASPAMVAARYMRDALERGEARDILFVGDDASFNNGRIGWRLLRLLLARDGRHARLIASAPGLSDAEALEPVDRALAAPPESPSTLIHKPTP
jgi:hypothetical protein